MNLGRNILWNLASFVWLSLLLIFVTPYMVHRMGLEVFGLWAIITAANVYLTAMDFGMANALIRFLAAENERGDRDALQKYLRSGTSLQMIMGSAWTVTLWLLAEPMARHWLQVPPELVEEAVGSIRLSAFSVLFGFLGLGYAAVPSALHRFDLLAMRSILLLSAQYLLVMFVLHLNGGLREVVAVYVAGTAGILVYLALIARKLLPGINILPGWHARSVSALLRFGRMKFPAQISVTLIQQLDRIVVGVLLPVAQVSFYVIPVRVSQRVGQVAETIASPIYPAVASHMVANRQEALRQQYGYGSRMIAMTAGGALAVLGGLAGPILKVWMGPEFAEAGAWPLRVLLLAYSASAFFTLPSVAADAASRPGLQAAFLTLGALLHAGIIWFAVEWWGILGAAVAVLIGFLVPAALGIPVIHRRLPILPRLPVLIRDVRGILLAVPATLLFVVALTRIFDPGAGVAALVLGIAASAAVYMGLLSLLGGIKADDLRRVLGIFAPERARGAR